MSVARNESLINEYKGNLFEYLVSQKIAQSFKIEKEFLSGLDQNLKKNLTLYQDKLRSLDENLFKQLPKLAHLTANDLCTYIKFKPEKIELIGKLGAHPQADYSEADLIIKGEDQVVPISLKLSKKGTATHTKSAGLKSFFIKYFDEPDRQEDFNKFLAISFNKMAINLHELEDLTFDNDFSSWKEHGFSEYPGELTSEQKNVLAKCYFELIEKVYQELSEVYLEDEAKLIRGVKSLMGFDIGDLVQVKCLYIHDVNRYQYDSTEIYKPRQKQSVEISLSEPKEGQASFEILLDNIRVQLRVKPMNKFTVPGYKLNCALLS